MIAIRSAAESHTGYVRTNNEDLAVVSSDLAAIADGMGGHLGGEVAARTAIEELVEAFQRDRTAAGLVAAVRRANRAIWRKSRVDRKLHGMGTTLTAAALLQGEDGAPPRLALVNVGDSRAYRLDRIDSDSPKLSRLTEDHSVVEEMVRQGDLTPAEAAMHPHRHVLTRALGIDSEVEVDVWDIEPLPGARYLLCTDGLSDEVPPEEIARVLASSEDPHEVAGELVGVALGHGGIDNVTVVVMDVVEAEPGSVEQPLEMVPAHLSMPDDDRLGPDVTQALPVTRRRRNAKGRDTATEAAAAPGPGPAPSDPVPYDVEAEEVDPTLALSREAPTTTSEQGAAGEVLPGTEEMAHGDTAGAPAVVGNGHSRSRRSMTVRGGQAPASLLHEPASDGRRSRATVLVPTRSLSKQYRDRIVTFRVFLFLVLLAALIGGMVAVVIWFQRSSYFVGLEGNRVSIYSGRPGGTLWFRPQIVGTTSLTTKNLLPNSVVELRHGITESSYQAAKQEVDALARLSYALGMGPKTPGISSAPAGSGTASSAGSATPHGT